MADIGYRAHLDLGYTNSDGNFTSFNESLIELSSCTYALIRGADERGKPQTDLIGGNITFTVSKLPSLTFIDWGTSPNKCYSGKIKILDLKDQTKESLSFENAVCVNFKMTYIHSGVSYTTVQITLQSEVIELQGARPLDNHWLNEKDRNSSRVETEADIKNEESEEGKDEKGKKEAKARAAINALLNSDASISAFMELGSMNYKLQGFEIEFTQLIDHKGQPQTAVMGGVATIEIDDTPCEGLNIWTRNNNALDGVFKFGDPQVGYPLSMRFKGATCIGYIVNLQTYSESSATSRLNIATKEINFDKGVRFKVPY